MSVITFLCQDIIEAGFADSETDKAIRFCNNCKYEECLLVDRTLRLRIKRDSRLEKIKELSKEHSIVEIASILNVSTRTIQRDLKELVSRWSSKSNKK